MKTAEIFPLKTTLIPVNKTIRRLISIEKGSNGKKDVVKIIGLINKKFLLPGNISSDRRRQK